MHQEVELIKILFSRTEAFIVSQFWRREVKIKVGQQAVLALQRAVGKNMFHASLLSW